ncbi:MAG: DNA recombination protein RmuC [Parvibaculaceae bacterium]
MSPEILIAVAAAAVVAMIVTVIMALILRRPAAVGGLSDSAELATIRDAKAEAERRLAAEERTAARVPELERQLREQQELVTSLRDAKAKAETSLAEIETRLAERTEALTAVRRELEQGRTQAEKAQAEVADLRTRIAGLEETLEQERAKAEEKLALLNTAKETLTAQFKVLADEIMTRHGETFTKQNKTQVEGLLAPLRDRIVEFQQGLQVTTTEATKERATLVEQIRRLTEQSQAMTAETQNLTKALKGKAQTQGAWGEMILATILERSGLRAGEEYSTQESHTGEDGARLRPDVVVKLPGGQRVVIDSKVSLTAFEEHVNGESDADRATALTRHVLSMRTHIKTLGSKDYHAAAGSDLDYVVMFVPIEGALAAAMDHQPDLTIYAAENNVAIATPTTLMMMLRTIANVWQVERRNQNAEAIAERAGRLYDKFVGFVGDLDTLGSRLDGARKSYDHAMGKLATGNGNIVRQLQQMKDLGARTNKSIPAELVDRAAVEVLAPTEAVENLSASGGMSGRVASDG